MVTNEEIENIRRNANIVDIISNYIPLTQKGKNYFGVCPFHEDHSPSLSVSTDKQIYKCFSCGASGNVFTFVSEYENVKFLEAVKIVADLCGLSFTPQIKSSNTSVNQTAYEIMNLASKFYQNNLNSQEGLVAKKYLETRSLNEEIQKEFEIGLSLSGAHSLHALALNKKYQLADLEALGLVGKRDDYVYDIFQRRIMFPIHDLDGRPVGFTGRIYEDSDQAKYINSKESRIFKKGLILFNYHRAKAAAKRKKEVIIVEGNMDAIRLYASGIKNVVALMGTSLTKEQIGIIKNLRAHVLLMFDNDEAGENATYQNGNLLKDHGINFDVIRLTQKKDPDEYIIAYGPQALEENIRNPISFLDFKLKYFKKNKDLSKTQDLVNYIKEIINDLNSLDDDLTKELTLKKISQDYDIPYNLLEKELAKIKAPQKKSSSKTPKPKTKLSKYDKACQNILYFMMNDSRFIRAFKQDLGFFNEKKYRDIANEIIYYYETNKDIDLSSFLAFVGPKDYIYDDILEILKICQINEFKADVFDEFISVAQKEMVKKEIEALKIQIANTTDANEEIALAQKLLNLKKGCVGNEK